MIVSTTSFQTTRIAMNTADRKQREEALRSSEARVASAIHVAEPSFCESGEDMDLSRSYGGSENAGT